MNRTQARTFDPVLSDLAGYLAQQDRADAAANEAMERPGLIEFRDALAAVAAAPDRLLRKLRDAWIESPGMFMREIADQLNHLGLRTRSGSPWRFEYVRRVLKRSTSAAA